MDSWLTTKGINNLEPIIVYNPDKSIRSFMIKQSNEKTTNNRLRKQIIDIAVYDQNYNKFIIGNVVINDNNTLSKVNHNFTFPVKAILINDNDYGYAKIRYDISTI